MSASGVTGATGAVEPVRAVVIGVGNAWRGDDGVGAAVADRLGERLGDGRSATPADRWTGGVDVVVLDGEPSRLLDAWDGAAVAVVVDAVAATGGPPAGSLVVWDGLAGTGPTPATGGASPSSHGLGVAEAVALGRALDRLPAALVVVGVVGAAFDDGTGLSAPVAAAVDCAVAAVLGALAPGGFDAPADASVEAPVGSPAPSPFEAVVVAADHHAGGDHVPR